MGPCTMNMGKAKDPRVAIGLHPKKRVMAEGLELKASRCMAFKNLVKRGTNSTPPGLMIELKPEGWRVNIGIFVFGMFGCECLLIPMIADLYFCS